MKRKRLWKPGGHPRRAVGSMRLNRQKAQRTMKDIISRKEAAVRGTGS